MASRWRRGGVEAREREKKNEYESAKDGAQVRGNEGNVCEKDRDTIRK